MPPPRAPRASGLADSLAEKALAVEPIVGLGMADDPGMSLGVRADIRKVPAGNVLASRIVDPPLPDELAFLRGIVSDRVLREAVQGAEEEGIPAALYLLRAGHLHAATYYRAFAESCALPFVEGPALPVHDGTAIALAFGGRDRPAHLRIDAKPLGARIAIAPALDRIAASARFAAAYPTLSHHVIVTTPATMERTVDAARHRARILLPERPEHLLHHCGVAPATVEILLHEARAAGLDPLVLAVRRGLVDEDRLVVRIARLYRRAPLAADDETVVLASPRRGKASVPVRRPAGNAEAVMPTLAGLRRLAALESPHGTPPSPVVASFSVLRERWRRANAARALVEAIHRLRIGAPVMSASGLFRRPVMAGIAASAILLVLVIAGAAGLPLFAAASAFAALVLLVLAAIRVAVIASLDRIAERPPPRLHDHDLPSYGVLVPLHREAESLSGLLTALSRLDYPREKLDIKLILEADDRETRDALAAFVLRPPFDVILVPAAMPRTKPKALAFALPETEGDLVTIFDAEDRPEPDQLRRVAERFAAAPPDLGCIQARLAVDHPDETWFTRNFALEYATLFDALLPWMAHHGIVFPLGGTSNHIRRGALDASGDWDPFNVTEDADLGIRLARHGWRLETIDATTWEEAPVDLATWFPQRTRWHKGWLQTWIVHMRRPLILWRDLGAKGFLAFQFMIGAGILVLAMHLVFALSVLAHAVAFAAGVPLDLPSAFAGGFFFAVFVIGYGAALLLACASARKRGLRVSPGLLLGLPAYWLLLGAALIAALCDLIRRPGHWAKTIHGLAAARPAASRGS